MLTNHGMMMIGGMNNVQRTNLTGSFIQSSTGQTYSELDFALDTKSGGRVDQFFATGTVSLDGEVIVSLLNTHLMPAGRFEKVLFHGDQGLTDNGIELVTAPSVVITYELLFPTGFDAVLSYYINFNPMIVEGMDRGPYSDCINLIEVGDYLNRIQDAGSSSALADVISTLLFIPDFEAKAFFSGAKSAEIFSCFRDHVGTQFHHNTAKFLAVGFDIKINSRQFLVLRYQRGHSRQQNCSGAKDKMFA